MAEKYVWLIGGSVMAEPMAREIGRRGYKLIISDSNPDCHCANMANQFLGMSVYDVEAHLAMARSDRLADKEIAAVLTIGTDAGPTVSALSEMFGLPGIGREKAELAKDKIRMRQALDMPEPYYYVYRAGDRPENFSPDKFPMILKAPDQAGSRGVTIVDNNAQYHDVAGRSETDLVGEELLRGQDMIPDWRQKYDMDTSEAAFDFFLQDGNVIYANGALRMFWKGARVIEAGHINPFEAVGELEDKRQIMRLARQAAKGLGLDWGVLKIDAKKDRRYGWCLLECATRLSGGFDHMYTSPLATGRDVTHVMLDVALGGRVNFDKLTNRKNRIACCLAPIYGAGPISGWTIETWDSGAERIFPMTQDYIRDLEANQDRPLFIIAAGQSPDEALQAALVAGKFVKPIRKDAKYYE